MNAATITERHQTPINTSSFDEYLDRIELDESSAHSLMGIDDLNLHLDEDVYTLTYENDVISAGVDLETIADKLGELLLSGVAAERDRLAYHAQELRSTAAAEIKAENDRIAAIRSRVVIDMAQDLTVNLATITPNVNGNFRRLRVTSEEIAAAAKLRAEKPARDKAAEGLDPFAGLAS